MLVELWQQDKLTRAPPSRCIGSFPRHPNHRLRHCYPRARRARQETRDGRARKTSSRHPRPRLAPSLPPTRRASTGGVERDGRNQRRSSPPVRDGAIGNPRRASLSSFAVRTRKPTVENRGKRRERIGTIDVIPLPDSERREPVVRRTKLCYQARPLSARDTPRFRIACCAPSRQRTHAIPIRRSRRRVAVGEARLAWRKRSDDLEGTRGNTFASRAFDLEPARAFAVIDPDEPRGPIIGWAYGELRGCFGLDRATFEISTECSGRDRPVRAVGRAPLVTTRRIVAKFELLVRLRGIDGDDRQRANRVFQIEIDAGDRSRQRRYSDGCRSHRGGRSRPRGRQKRSGGGRFLRARSLEERPLRLPGTRSGNDAIDPNADPQPSRRVQPAPGRMGHDLDQSAELRFDPQVGAAPGSLFDSVDEVGLGSDSASGRSTNDPKHRRRARDRYLRSRTRRVQPHHRWRSPPRQCRGSKRRCVRSRPAQGRPTRGHRTVRAQRWNGRSCHASMGRQTSRRSGKS